MTIAQYTTAAKSFSIEATFQHDAFVYGRLVGGVLKRSVQPLKYRAVQRQCKALGISAKGSLNDLRKALWEHEHGDAKPAPVPQTREQRKTTRPKSEPVAQFDYEAAYALQSADCYECPDVEATTNEAPQPETTQANHETVPAPVVKPAHQPATYREMQRLIKWFRENDYYVPSRKNTGRENVAANVDELMDTQRFWDILGHERYAESIAQFTGREW